MPTGAHRRVRPARMRFSELRAVARDMIEMTATADIAGDENFDSIDLGTSKITR